MKRPGKLVPVVLALFFAMGLAPAKKIKNSFSIEKERKKSANKKDIPFTGREFSLTDTIDSSDSLLLAIDSQLRLCTFAGYDKEVNSSKESFILLNKSDNLITGFKVRIDYLDMQGRMLHSRSLVQRCVVPPNENRRFDVNSWDTQFTYYYHLGNTPKRVATPFQVKFTPLAFWVE